MGDQLAQAASVQQLLMAGSASRLSVAMDQVLEGMGLHACDWQGKPSEEDLPMLGLHPTEGLCWVIAVSAEPGFWSCRTPWGMDEKKFTGSSWLFTAIKPSAPHLLQANTWGLALGRTRNHHRPLIQLGAVTVIFNAMAWGGGFFLMHRYPQALQHFGLHELMLLTAVTAIGMALNMSLEAARLMLMRKAIASSQPVHIEQDAHRPLIRLMFMSFCFVALDIPLALAMMLTIYLQGPPVLVMVPAVYVVLKTCTGLLTFRRARQLVKARGNSLNGEFVSSPPVETETVRSLGIPSQLKRRLHAMNQDQLRQNDLIHRFAVWALRDDHGMRQLGFLAWLIITLDLSTASNGLSLGVWLATSLWAMRIIASVLILPLLTLIWLQGTWVLLSEQGMRRQMGLAPEQPVANTSTLKEGHYQLSMVCFNHPAQVDGLFVAGMSIKPGERIALMGDPGSGKSTLIKLLAGMHAPDSGAVKLDRFHVKDTAPRLLQQELAYLPQNVQLLTGTLRDNLLAGQENVPDSDLLDLCQSIGLMPLINAHGEGLSMPLHNSHQGVSAGQRQLIGLARLFLRRPRIWLLDEPFAHLNAPLRHRVLGLLQSRIRPDQTLICTGDQAELLHLVQRFVVMGSGRVVMDGPSDQVMPRWLAYLQQRKSSFDPKSGAEYQI